MQNDRDDGDEGTASEPDLVEDGRDADVPEIDWTVWIDNPQSESFRRCVHITGICCVFSRDELMGFLWRLYEEELDSWDCVQALSYRQGSVVDGKVW